MRFSNFVVVGSILCGSCLLLSPSSVHAQSTQPSGESKSPSKTPIHANDGESATAEVKKYALVIGNTHYAGDAVLKNPRNDAEDMAAKLRSLGFDVIVGYDLTHAQMREKLTEFSRKIEKRNAHDLALFYYSGHGLQYEEKNYLIPLGAENTTINLLEIDTLGVDTILKMMRADRHGGNIVILDACRDNPFSFGSAGEKGSKNGKGNKGLAVVSGGDNTLIAYATNAGKTASDNTAGRNGLYTGELLQHLGTPNVSLLDVFVNTRRGVIEKSGGAQDPRELNSLLENPVLLRKDGVPVLCPSGSAWNGSACVGVASVVCPENSTWDGKQCMGQLVSIPPKQPVLSSDVWVTLPSGSFMMGCVDGDVDCGEAEKGSNRHSESVSSFQLMRTEVTVDMYKKCVDAGKCSAPQDKSFSSDCNWGYRDRGNHPVNCVNGFQALEYCAHIGGRLPRDTEWEYAAKSGGQNQKYPWGDAKATCTYAVIAYGSTACGKDRTWPVCSKPRGNSAQGICDLSGNVAEFTSVADDADSMKALRGGSWYDHWPATRASHYYSESPLTENEFIGFRCAR